MIVFSTLRGCLAGFMACGKAALFTLHTAQILGLVFSWKTKGIWIGVLHRSCSCICKLDVRLLNHPNWTSTAQVMVHFLRLPYLRRFIYLRPDLGLFGD